LPCTKGCPRFSARECQGSPGNLTPPQGGVQSDFRRPESEVCVVPNPTAWLWLWLGGQSDHSVARRECRDANVGDGAPPVAPPGDTGRQTLRVSVRLPQPIGAGGLQPMNSAIVWIHAAPKDRSESCHGEKPWHPKTGSAARIARPVDGNRCRTKMPRHAANVTCGVC